MDSEEINYHYSRVQILTPVFFNLLKIQIPLFLHKAPQMSQVQGASTNTNYSIKSEAKQKNGVFWSLGDLQGVWGQILGRARSSRHGFLGNSWVTLLLLLFPRNSGNSGGMQWWLLSTTRAFHWHVTISEALPKVWRIQWWPPSVWQALASSPN